MSTNAVPEHTDEPERLGHPLTLKTRADYEDAPEGTVVDIDGMVAEHKIYGWWVIEDLRGEVRSRHMPGFGEGKVVIWGWW